MSDFAKLRPDETGFETNASQWHAAVRATHGKNAIFVRAKPNEIEDAYTPDGRHLGYMDGMLAYVLNKPKATPSPGVTKGAVHVDDNGKTIPGGVKEGFLSELKRLKEASEVKNVVFKLEIPSEAEELLALKKDAQMAAIEGEEGGDDSFIQNQDVVTVEYITREGNKILVYPMLDALKSADVSTLGAKLQKAFNTWCLEYEGGEDLDEAVRAQMQDLNAKPGEQVRKPQTPEERKALADKVRNNRAAGRATNEFPGSRAGAQSGRSNYYVDRRHGTGMDVAVTNEESSLIESPVDAMEVFGDIGDKLDSISSMIGHEFEEKMGKVEADHQVYLGENIRELRHLIKLAKRTVQNLHNSVEDLPMNEDN